MSTLQEAVRSIRSLNDEVCDAAAVLFAANDAPIYLMRDDEPVVVLVSPEWHERAALEVPR
jgi:hypothetical protein